MKRIKMFKIVDKDGCEVEIKIKFSQKKAYSTDFKSSFNYFIDAIYLALLKQYHQEQIKETK